jgi:hypothetical protein
MEKDNGGFQEIRQILRRFGKTVKKAQMIFCFLARELGFPTRETGDFLGIQQAAVSNTARTGATIAKKLKISWK